MSAEDAHRFAVWGLRARLDPTMPEGVIGVEARPPARARHAVRRRRRASALGIPGVEWLELVHEPAADGTGGLIIAHASAVLDAYVPPPTLPIATACEHCDGALISATGAVLLDARGESRARADWRAAMRDRVPSLDMLYALDGWAAAARRRAEVAAYGPPNKAAESAGRVMRTPADAWPCAGDAGNAAAGRGRVFRDIVEAELRIRASMASPASVSRIIGVDPS